MNKTEATSKIIVAMIENDFFKKDLLNKNSDAGTEAVAQAFKTIYETIQAKTV